jgi:enoyl-[acyl-carrier protein] reductase / trans-2-enoyl-CoA reductase (NAD+)
MIVRPKVRGFVCVTAHPLGCAAHIQEQIAYIRRMGPIRNGPKKALIIGSSTGYGLASRITAAFGSGAGTFGVYFDRPPAEDRPATPGWYNTRAFEREARAAGLFAGSLNGDAFSDSIKQQAVELIRKDLGTLDLVVYSVAAPRRVHPRTGVVHKSVLKPVGQSYTNKTVDTDLGIVSEITIGPATSEEIADTVAVMGGEDWELWMQTLDKAGLLAPGATAVSYSYIGPEVTWPIYRNGTIGLAKDDLERAARRIDAMLKASGYGRAFVSINKALVTQASSAIPVVPLYISALYKIMKALGTHEGCIEQIQRLFSTQMYNGSALAFDETGRVRLDDREMRPAVQEKIREIWTQIATENLSELTDIEGYRAEFLKLFGFGISGVDYDADVEP